MKRKTISTACGCIALLLLCLVIFLGCAGGVAGDDTKNKQNMNLGTFPGLSAETEERIIKDYYNTFIEPQYSDRYTLNEISVYAFYGDYNDCIVVSIIYPWDGLAGINYEYCIAGINFYHGCLPPTVWKDGQFFGMGEYLPSHSGGGLAEAYNLGLLTQDDLRNIASQLNTPGYPVE